MKGSGAGVGHGGRRWAFVAAGTGLVAAMWLGGAGGSGAAECPPDRLLCRLLSSPPTTAPAQPAPAVVVPTLPPVTVAPPPPPAGPRSAPEAAQRLLDLVNAERAKAGLGRLSSRGDVTAIALDHSTKMAAAGNIFHNDSYFSDAVQRLLGSKARGENVAQNSSVDDTHARLMNSPGHRANILDPRFTVAGFAVVQAPDGRYYTTQDFLQPAGSVPAVPAVPAAAAAAPRKPASTGALPVRTTPAVVAAQVPTPTPPAPQEAPAGEDTVTAARGAAGSSTPGDLGDAGRLPAASRGDGMPGTPSPGTWLAAALLLALVASGTAQVGRGAGRRGATAR